MKKIAKKGILQKAIISIVVVFMLSSIVLPTVSHADFGGTLFEPIKDLLAVLGDVGMWIANMASGENASAIKNYGQGGTYGDFKWPEFHATPEKIFSNRVPLVDADIISPSSNSVTRDLRPLIASWYKTFRNIAAIGLLSVLAYTAIRILISSTASDKAKYKNMLKDWLVAFCLLFFMHYIMSFSLTIVKSLTNSIHEASNYGITAEMAAENIPEQYGDWDVDDNITSKDGKELIEWAGIDPDSEVRIN